MGEIAPSDLPPAKRGEALVMYAEATDGEHYTREWDIIKDARGRRRIRLDPLELPKVAMTRFWPSFVVDDMLRKLDHGDIDVPEPLLRLLLDASSDITPEERRLSVTRAACVALLSGSGSTTRSYERASHDIHRQAIEWIVKRGRT